MSLNWSPFVPAIRNWVATNPLANMVLAPARPAQLNQFFQEPAVTLANISQWETASAAAQILNEGVLPMAGTAPHTVVGAKKCDFLLSAGGGWSESFFTQANNVTHEQAIAKLSALGYDRENLSWTVRDQLPAPPPPRNQISIDFLRVSDEDITKDSLVLPYTYQAAYSGGATIFNLPANVCAKIKWYIKATPDVFAVTYLRGLVNQPSGSGAANLVDLRNWSRTTPMPPGYKVWLDAFLAKMQAQGLGFRKQLTTGNGTRQNPVAAGVTYDVPTQLYSIKVANPWPAASFVALMRGFKGEFRALNGRHPAVRSLTDPTIAILQKPFRDLGAWNGQGTIAQLIWNYWVPDAYTWTLMTTKKLGRPFYLQRGRRSAIRS